MKVGIIKAKVTTSPIMNTDLNLVKTNSQLSQMLATEIELDPIFARDHLKMRKNKKKGKESITNRLSKETEIFETLNNDYRGKKSELNELEKKLSINKRQCSYNNALINQHQDFKKYHENELRKLFIEDPNSQMLRLEIKSINEFEDKIRDLSNENKLLIEERYFIQLDHDTIHQNILMLESDIDSQQLSIRDLRLLLKSKEIEINQEEIRKREKEEEQEEKQRETELIERREREENILRARQKEEENIRYEKIRKEEIERRKEIEREEEEKEREREEERVNGRTEEIDEISILNMSSSYSETDDRLMTLKSVKDMKTIDFFLIDRSILSWNRIFEEEKELLEEIEDYNIRLKK